MVGLLEKPSKVRLCNSDNPSLEMLRSLYESPTSVPVAVEGDATG